MDRIGDSILQLVLDCRGTEEEQVLLDDFSCLIQSVTTTVDRLCRLIIDRGPFLVLLFWYLSVGEAECPQSISRVFLEGIDLSRTPGSHRSTDLEVDKSGICIRLIGTEALSNDGVGTLAVQLDSPIRTSDDCGHALPRRIELANVKDLEFLIHAVDLDENRPRFASLYLLSEKAQLSRCEGHLRGTDTPVTLIRRLVLPRRDCLPGT